MSNAKKTGIVVGMAALGLLGLTTGCRSGSGGGIFGDSNPFSGNWSCSSLTEAESAGSRANADLATMPTGALVRVWSESPLDNVTLEVLGGDFADVALGEHVAGPDGLIFAGDILVDVMRCTGDTEDEVVCAPIAAAAIEIDVLEDGARRVFYDGTSADGVAVEGSFVVGR